MSREHAASRETWPDERTTEQVPAMAGLHERQALASRLMRMAVEVREGYINADSMATLNAILDDVEVP
jgi:hypothetical protein